ncbi:MAG: TonB-dependent receptor [Tannerellaceae bacterium]|nr:TonB-dependent receptor [Tannerellaceae bacterium]
MGKWLFYFFVSVGMIMASAMSARAQSVKATGTVSDATGETMIGVNILQKGTTNGTVTDFDGKFSLDVPAGAVISINYIGYATQEIIIKDANPLRITLSEDVKTLDEVIVIGYGTTTRKSAVGAVDQVRKEMLENRPVANATLALQGAAPNVIIQRRNHDPNNESTNFNIRGFNSSTDNTPLFVIDGLVMDGTAFNRLNPNDIENISILKDAGTAAIYGSRSAAGVVVVTTKSGSKNQKPTVSLSSMVGWDATNYLFDAVPGYQNAILENMQSTNIGKAPTHSQDAIQDYYDHLGEENWAYRQIYKTTMQQIYNASVSGGTDKSTYMISAGYFDQDNNYNVSNQDLGVKRYNFRTNLSTEIGRLKVTAIMDYTRNNSRKTTAGNIDIDASRVPAWYTEKIVADDGRYLLTPTLGEYNTLGELNKGGYESNINNHLTANLNLEFTIMDGLKLRGVFGANVVGERRDRHNKPQTYYRNESDTEPIPVREQDNTVENWNRDSYRLNSQLLLDYQKGFGLHNINAMIGVTNESYTSVDNGVVKRYVDELGNPTSITTGVLGNITGNTFIENNSRTSINSLLGRLGYNWNERYYAEFTFRYDGSSKFHKDYRWGFFPSMSAAWRLSEESFMDSYKENVGDLKVRGSYGILGNQAVGNYDRFTIYNINANGYIFNNSAVSSAGYTLGMDDLTWERTKTFNIGVDASFLNNRLSLQADYYVKNTSDILMSPVVPSVFGTGMPRDNIGEMRNRGWEFLVNYRLNTGEFRHNFSFNIGDSKNEVITFPGHEQISGHDEIYSLIREGETYGSYYGWKTEGLFQSWDEIANSALPSGYRSAAVTGNMGDIAPGDVKYKDQNSDGIIDDKDRVVLGTAYPRYTFGFTYNVSWKDFDLSMFWQGVGNRSMMLRGEMVEPYHANYSKTMYKHQLDFWTATNTEARWPRLTESGSPAHTNNWGQPSGNYILNAAYLRLKNIAIGYTLPKRWIQPLGVGNVRVYVNAQDLFTFTKNDFIDPESSEKDSRMGNSGGSMSGRQYQPSRYYGVGFNIDF